MTTKLFHPLLAMIASATGRELAKQVQYLDEENKILRARIPGQIHTKPAERERLLKFGKRIGKSIEELITIVSPSTFYGWLQQEDKKKPSIRKCSPIIRRFQGGGGRGGVRGLRWTLAGGPGECIRDERLPSNPVRDRAEFGYRTCSWQRGGEVCR